MVPTGVNPKKKKRKDRWRKTGTTKRIQGYVRLSILLWPHLTCGKREEGDVFLRPICHISNKKALINDLYLDIANLIFGYIYDSPMSARCSSIFFFFWGGTYYFSSNPLTLITHPWIGINQNLTLIQLSLTIGLKMIQWKDRKVMCLWGSFIAPSLGPSCGHVSFCAGSLFLTWNLLLACPPYYWFLIIHT